MQSLWKDLQPKGGSADTHGATYRGETSYVLALSCFFLPKRKPSFTCSASSLSGNTPCITCHVVIGLSLYMCVGRAYL